MCTMEKSTCALERNCDIANKNGIGFSAWFFLSSMSSCFGFRGWGCQLHKPWSVESLQRSLRLIGVNKYGTFGRIFVFLSGKVISDTQHFGDDNYNKDLRLTDQFVCQKSIFTSSFPSIIIKLLFYNIIIIPYLFMWTTISFYNIISGITGIFANS